MVENTQIFKIMEITAKIMALEKGRMIEGSGIHWVWQKTLCIKETLLQVLPMWHAKKMD